MRDLLAYINYLTKMFRICLELENYRFAIIDGKIQRKSTLSEIFENKIALGGHIFHKLALSFRINAWGKD